MYKLFIFDFDGTVGDTQDCVVDSFQSALSVNEIAPADREDIVHTMGLSLTRAFAELIDGEHDGEFYDKLALDYRSFYSELLPEKTLMFPGVPETLQRIKDKGAVSTIATSKKTELARLSCAHLGIDGYFDLFIGDDEVSNKKPHPEMLLRTLGTFSVETAQAVMIGDSTYDIEMGNAIGMDTIGVTWGAHSEELLRSACPTRIVHQFSELSAFAHG